MADQQTSRETHGESFAGAPLAEASSRLPSSGTTLIDIEAFVELPAETNPRDRRAIVELWRRAEADALLSGELLQPSSN